MDDLHLPEAKYGVYLERNAHRDIYDTVANVIAEGHYQWRDAESQSRAVASDEVWTLQWYPRTPISFYAIAAPTLRDLLEYAAEIEAKDKKSDE